MTRPSKRELEREIEDLAREGSDQDIEVCCSWIDGGCEHETHVVVADFTDVDT